MPKAHKPGRKPGRRSARTILEAIPLEGLTAGAQRLALKFDELVITGTVQSKAGAALQAQLIGATIRGGLTTKGGKPRFDFRGVPAGFSWPTTLYVPRDHASVGFPKPPVSQLYTDSWASIDGAATADRETGALFALAGARTTDGPEVAEAGVGIRYSPPNTMSFIRFEPEVNCAVSYREFVNFWPNLIAGSVRARADVMVAAWEQIGLSGPFYLYDWQAFPVFDTGSMDAGSHMFPDVRYAFQRNFSNAALSRRFLVRSGRTYVLGAVARVQVEHNVTTNYGKPIPHDPTKFKLYSQMVCAVPYMTVSVDQVITP